LMRGEEIPILTADHFTKTNGKAKKKCGGLSTTLFAMRL
jgi:hypothetical protein